MRSFSRKKLSAHDARELGNFLSNCDRPEGTLSLHALRGFMFAIACFPELIMPSEWLPLISNDDDMAYEDLKQAQRILNLIMGLYNEINVTVIERSDAMPPGCEFHTETAANLDQQAPLSQWSRGFTLAHNWLGGPWKQRVPDERSEMSKELAACMMTLSFFSSRQMAEAFYRESGGKRRRVQQRSFEEFAEIMRKHFPSALASYANLGRTISEALASEGGLRE
ncbi:MAG: YecA family protein [Burkholderiales bacterium]